MLFKVGLDILPFCSFYVCEKKITIAIIIEEAAKELIELIKQPSFTMTAKLSIKKPGQ